MPQWDQWFACTPSVLHMTVCFMTVCGFTLALGHLGLLAIVKRSQLAGCGLSPWSDTFDLEAPAQHLQPAARHQHRCTAMIHANAVHPYVLLICR